jgi:hypothetical protein
MKINVPNHRGSRREPAHSDLSGLTSAATGFAPRAARLDSGFQPSTFNSQPSQRGIALVITLILLSVTLVMAIAFLAISRRERNSVTTTTDTATAKLAADSALAHAEAQIVVNVLVTTNPYNFGLLISTNYINTLGYDPGVSGYNPTNVNYSYTNGNPLDAADSLQNLANLLYSPRPPVFVPTNSLGSNDFRFYLDLNRNGRFEDTFSNAPNVEVDPITSVVTTNGTIPVVGDPQWIGVLARPDMPHGPNNYFVARYAFFAAPVGNTLDLNYIHNQAFNPNLGANDGFFRNQGVGSWEINLAAFLTDLNTNEWDTTIAPYNYLEPASANNGFAFQDALSLLYYRYNGVSLPTVSTLLPNYPLTGPVDILPFGPEMTNTGVPFYNYSLNNSWPGADNTNHYFNLPSDLFDPTKAEKNVIPPTPGFIERLNDAGAQVDTYDRYTFYRLLSQLGTDSDPDEGRINLNYSNAVAYADNNGVVTNITVIPNAETNLTPWQPLQFFTIAADRMLRLYTTNWFQENPTRYLATYYGITNYNGDTNYYHVNPDFSVLTNDPTGLGLTNIPFFGMTNQVPAFGITNIPVLMNSNFVYPSSVNRLLQLAANMYDATTNNFYPDVFRPIFEHDINGNIFVVGYTMPANGGVLNTVSGIGDLQLAQPIDVTTFLTPLYPANIPTLVNVYGVPWIVGAKKGFPNFNEFSMNTVVQITRKLQIGKTNATSPPSLAFTNQMYVFRINNSLGVEFWNSYTNQYLNPVQVFVQDTNSMTLTSTDGMTTFYSANYSVPTPSSTNVPTWQGTTWQQFSGALDDSTQPFIIPLNTNVLVLTNSIYRFSSASFVPDSSIPIWENTDPSTPPLPQMLLLMTNRLQAFILDGTHIIDYVQFNGPNQSRNLNSEFQTNGTGSSFANIFSTALDNNGLQWGINSQIEVSEGVDYTHADPYWGQGASQRTSEILGFRAFMGSPLPILDPSVLAAPIIAGLSNSIATNLVVQVPFTPTFTVYDYTSWQANDPLVHYLASDLNFSGNDKNSIETGVNVLTLNSTNVTAPLPDLGDLNERYKPWYLGNDADQLKGNDIRYKDSLMAQSDFWDFPANKLPTVGWLGRVHRGTPWQTVYLKAADVLLQTNTFNNVIGTNTWVGWVGNINTNDAVNTAPTQDRLLFDIFTTALNDNATRGQLPVNVGAGVNDPSAGLAAWSALFSGTTVLSNSADSSLVGVYFLNGLPMTVTNLTIDPAGLAGLNSALGKLVKNIYDTRTNFVNVDGLKGVFEHKGDVLASPLLSEQSPFLNWNDPAQQQYGISDELYEWLPQQTMSLLRSPSAPRYVVYCYGQTLKPAPNSLVTSVLAGSQFFGMCTNYQITAESVVRAVIRVDDANTSHPRAVVESYNLLPSD